jgi:hypothetical protein
VRPEDRLRKVGKNRVSTAGELEDFLLGRTTIAQPREVA